jgi:CubicO group peptidase (beta-lactamase class C family)
MITEHAEVQGFDPLRLARVATRINADLDAGRYHGAALRVARRGEVVLDLTLGHADRAAGRALTKDAAFVSFSVGKQFTNALVLNRIERGDLHLAMQVRDIIPEFASRGLREINVFQLLTHTSGLMSAQRVGASWSVVLSFSTTMHPPRTPSTQRHAAAPAGRL